jgi:hypothetical protein
MVSKYRGYRVRVYSMNKTGGKEIVYNYSTNVAIERAGVKYLFSTFSSLCFRVKTVYNYGHRTHSHKAISPQRRGLRRD